MNTIKLNTDFYQVNMSFNLNTITIKQKEGFGERTYDLPSINVVDVEQGQEDYSQGYLYIFFEDKSHFQVKFESDHEIVIDHFKNDGELIQEIGAWDFHDDEEEFRPKLF